MDNNNKLLRSVMGNAAIRLILCIGFASLTTGPSWALGTHDLVGIWIVESASPQGMLKDAVEFSDTRGGIAGTWNALITRDGPLIKGEINELTQKDDAVSFKVNFEFAGASYKQFWTGSSVVKDQLAMRWIAEDGHLVRTRVFRRVSSKELADVRANAPDNLIRHPVSLPTLQELPFNGLALAPPMGWSSWNHFKEGIDDRAVRETADAMVSGGLRDAGYVFVNIDDGWQGHRDENGVLHPNSKFPDMKALAEYVHAKGLKLGIYSSPGPITCTGYVGSHGYEIQDARRFAEWGIDLIRHDWCSAVSIYKTKQEMQAVYQKMGQALQAAGRPIIYTLCQYGLFDVGSWGRKVGGNMWRTGSDMVEGQRWPTMSERFETNGNVEDNAPGGWNDPDHMVIGMGGMTTEEQRTHMTLWAIQAAPLILGNDIRVMTPEVKDILLNKEVIAIDQDSLGKQGRRVIKRGATEVWVKPLSDGGHAIAFFNRGDNAATLEVRWSDLGLAQGQMVRDLWKRTELGNLHDEYRVTIERHGSVLVRASPIQRRISKLNEKDR